MNKMSLSVESYAHKAAKRVLIEWLRNAAARDIDKDRAEFCGFTWRVNRGAPYYGVWEEYPFANGYGYSPVWDESGWWQELQRARGIETEDWAPAGRQNHPTYDELIELGWRPDIILDVAIQHKGVCVAGFEIVHKHGLSDKKRNYLRSTGIEIYVLSADWILSQVRPPEKLVTIETLNVRPQSRIALTCVADR